MFLASNTQIEIPNNGECRVCSKTLYGQRRKFCSVECGNTFHNNENKTIVLHIVKNNIYILKIKTLRQRMARVKENKLYQINIKIGLVVLMTKRL